MSQVITASFNGAPCTVEYSLTLGVSPGSGSVDFPDTSVRLPYKGTLRMSDGERSVTLSNVYVDKPRIEGNAESGYRLSATIHDRRYAWQWGIIFGTYNKPDITNTPTKEVKLLDLIKLCLAALGETSYNLIAIPVAYPFVRWEPENPANALDDLCDEFGLVVGLDTTKADNPIIISPYNAERVAPEALISEGMEGQSSALKPSALYFIGGRNVIQRTFRNLIAVGEDTDGSIKRIDDLSYAPDDWGKSMGKLFTDLNDPLHVELADKCIFKWYAVDWDKYDYDTQLPFLSDIVDTIVDEGETKRDKPYVLGSKVVWDGVSFVNKDNEKISDGFQLDKDLGIVKFNEPLVETVSEGMADVYFRPGKVNLVAAYEQKNNNSVLDFYQDKIAVPNGTEIPHYYDDRKVVAMFKPEESSAAINFAEIKEHSAKILTSALQYFTHRYPKLYTYPGIYNLGAWGAVRNVTWRADPEMGAITEINFDMEIPKPLMPDYLERDMKRKFRILWKTRKDTREVRREWPFE